MDARTARDDASKPRRDRSAVALLIVLAAAAALRLHGLTAESLWHDELLALENSTGRGFAHWRLPAEEVIEEPPLLTRLPADAAWWRVWTSLGDDTHPPLYFVVLRLWRRAFGEDEAAARSLSVVFSLLAVGALFVAVRRLSGPGPALWASALMAVAPLQIRYAQEARGYSMALFFALGAAAVLAALGRDGPTRGSLPLLAVCLLGASLTHYFVLPLLAALALYAVFWMRGRAREHALAAFATAALVSLAVWGPLAFAQRGNLEHAFLVETGPGHAWLTCERVLAMPLWLLTGRGDTPGRFDGLAGLGILVALALAARRRDHAAWWLWLGAYVVALGGLDMARSTRHLALARYAMLAGPGLYALLAGAFRESRGFWRHAVPAGAVVLCVVDLASAYPAKPGWRELGVFLRNTLQPREVLVFSLPDSPSWYPPAMYLAVSHYVGERPPPVLLLSRPIRPAVLARVTEPASAWVLTAPDASPLDLLGSGRIEQRLDWQPLGVLSRVSFAGR